MSGTTLGGKRAAASNKQKFGDDFYARIGSIGGQRGHTGGFWHAKYIRGDIDFVRACGAKGGVISRREPAGVKRDSSLRILAALKDSAEESL